MSATSSAIENKAVALLTTGFLELYEPHLTKAKLALNELEFKQNKIDERLVEIKANLVCENWKQTEDMMERIREYRSKLLTIKRKMSQIHQKAKHLKKTSSNIQISKQKELNTKLRKLEQETALISINKES